MLLLYVHIRIGKSGAFERKVSLGCTILRGDNIVTMIPEHGPGKDVCFYCFSLKVMMFSFFFIILNIS